MVRMVRKQLYIEPRQDRQLKRLARERGVTEAQLVREALDRLATVSKSAADEVWEREVAFMRKLQAAGPLPARARDWKREDLYEERRHRYERHFS